ncbi:class I ribonucleotide reductase maintenance protein YfaE [Erwinia tracheiphila]|uniref:2Fe-2S ferredoxin n=1 Tax=Erwinia tracheiphila TaxID=65700 RepID=A0A0M2KD41_9GAMM|nr:class I ribonucleotide reductase maintenance protein YfaE [Erwinia tracheiphila]AXF76465.1 2Fe-2S ferredoxin-like protein [Erwinia tracheiphila]EOS96246.1 2Fe-2S ferredoxin YfaE [Erwinia tracheiphila PSU-1]KKF35207.1 2Fe-2S ferredoxin [Erwinia tracheiphila]UIA84870.1 class I ribonucleotide reductase maintenance protein YfaE [Erwinia tracheiphila]UIA86862.1 class I ribonucleotide reductase maintenance protein YfaE [Erwinia tracheiphila]
MAGAMITLRTSGTQLYCREEHRSLLDTLEAHRIPVDYQCREGYCGSCRTRLLKGEVCYLARPLAFVQQDEILPCCCMAKGDIELEL